MVTQVSKSQFKAKALEYFRQIESSGDSIIITDHGRPTLEVRVFAQPKKDPRAFLRGTLLRHDDPFEPVGVEDWDALK